MSTVPARAGTPWYRQPLVWMLIAIPLSSVVMGVVIVTLAITSYDGLVADDYYKRGMEINRSLARDRAAAVLGLRGTLELDGGAVRIALRSAPAFDAPPVIVLGIHHATRAGLDRRIELRLAGSGDYTGRWEDLEPGAWNLQLTGGDWRLVGRLHLPAGTGAVLEPAAR